MQPVQWLIPKPADQQVKLDANRSKYDRGYTNNDVGSLPEFGADRAVKTSTEGKFTIKNLPDEFRIGLSVKSAGTKEEIIFKRPDGDAGVEDFEGQVFETDGFTHRLEPCSVLKIKATVAETGDVAKIGRITMQLISEREGEMFRRSETFESSTATATLINYKDGSIAWIEPLDTRKLLGVRIELPANGETETIEREVEFKTGKPIRGRVTSRKTGEPLKGVHLLADG